MEKPLIKVIFSVHILKIKSLTSHTFHLTPTFLCIDHHIKLLIMDKRKADPKQDSSHWLTRQKSFSASFTFASWVVSLQPLFIPIQMFFCYQMFEGQLGAPYIKHFDMKKKSQTVCCNNPLSASSLYIRSPYRCSLNTYSNIFCQGTSGS